MNLSDRFWSKVLVGSASECWEWQAATRNGYGHFGRSSLAHRVSWEMAHGTVPIGKCVCHKCDNPKCVNPSHLFLGTQTENLSDRNRKGRQAKGERNARAKLTERRVAEIRAAIGTTTEIARRYGVHQTTVSSIRRGATWAHL